MSKYVQDPFVDSRGLYGNLMPVLEPTISPEIHLGSVNDIVPRYSPYFVLAFAVPAVLNLSDESPFLLFKNFGFLAASNLRKTLSSHILAARDVTHILRTWITSGSPNFFRKALTCLELVK